MTSRAQRLPHDPEFEARVRASLERQRFMTLLGARLSTIAPGVVEIELPVADELTQQNGFLHAGALLAALDSACDYAALTLMPARPEVLTVELKSNLLAPVRSGTVKARGEVLRAGRVLTVCHGDAFEVIGKRGDSCRDDACDDDRARRGCCCDHVGLSSCRPPRGEEGDAGARGLFRPPFTGTPGKAGTDNQASADTTGFRPRRVTSFRSPSAAAMNSLAHGQGCTPSGHSIALNRSVNVP
jgi:uncharacterized protein (TIGR00369 family)